MSEQSSPMLERLQEFLKARPGDSFVRYGLAMELSKLGRTAEAVTNFQQVIEQDPDYVPAYQQAGMILAREGRKKEAKQIFSKGIEAAARKGDAHAYSELQGALAETEY